MLLSNATRISRMLSHWTGTILGIVAGVFLFRAGIQDFFTGKVSDWLSMIILAAGVLSMLSLLPLSILGIFKPRVAAYGVIAQFVVLMAVFVTSTVESPHKIEFSITGLALLSLYFVVPPCAVAGLLLHASGSDTTSVRSGDDHREVKAEAPTLPSASSSGRRMTRFLNALRAAGRKKQAQWAGVVLGFFAGWLGFRWGLYSVFRSAGERDWLGVVGMSATALTMLPLSILAVFKVRAAAYAALISLAVALAYPLILFHPPQFGASEIFGGMFWDLLFDFPLALVAALLLYASAGPNRQA